MSASYLVRRNAIFYFRMRVPQDLRRQLHRSEIKISTKTDNPWLARVRASIISAHVHQCLNEARQGASKMIDLKKIQEGAFLGLTTLETPSGIKLSADLPGNPDAELQQIASLLKLLTEQQLGLEAAPKPVELAATAANRPLAESNKPISQCFEDFAAYNTDPRNATWSQATIDDYRDTRLLYINYLGIDKPLREISLTEHLGFRDALMKIPSNRSKKLAYRGKSVQQLLQTDIPPADLMSQSTITNHLTRANALFSWLKSKQLTQFEPLKKLNSKRTKLPSEMRDAFSKADLSQLFTHI